MPAVAPTWAALAAADCREGTVYRAYGEVPLCRSHCSSILVMVSRLRTHFTSLQMPEEFNFDPDIMELKEEIKAMQQEFIELHKSSDAIKTLSK